MKQKWLQILFILFLSVSSVTIHAQENALSKKEAIAKVVSAYPGKVLKTANIKRQGTQYYRVRVLMSDGRIINVLVNAKTGRLRKE